MQGSICVDLETIATLAVEPALPVDGATSDAVTDAPDDLPWPDPATWLAEVAASPLVTEEVLRLEGSDLYLDRYWREEGQVCDDLVTRMRRTPPELDETMLRVGIDRVFPESGYDEQRTAVRAGAGQWTTILTGGPGTGKTTAVAGLLTLIAEQHEASTGHPGSPCAHPPARPRPACRRPSPRRRASWMTWPTGSGSPG